METACVLEPPSGTQRYLTNVSFATTIILTQRYEYSIIFCNKCSAMALHLLQNIILYSQRYVSIIVVAKLTLVRYLYVPLGGSKTQAVSIWIIYSFIGLWHDLLSRWLAWAWCNCVFFSIEIVVMKTFYSDRFAWLWSKPYWRHIIGVAGVFNIYLLIIYGKVKRFFDLAESKW